MTPERLYAVQVEISQTVYVVAGSAGEARIIAGERADPGCHTVRVFPDPVVPDAIDADWRDTMPMRSAMVAGDPRAADVRTCREIAAAEMAARQARLPGVKP